MENQTKLADLITKNIEGVEDKVKLFRTRSNRIMLTTIIASGASTLIAGVTSAVGDAAQIGTEGWRLACILAAAFGFVSTISSGISKQQNLTDKLSEGKECLSRLKYLKTVGITGTKDWPEISQEFEAMVVRYPELLG